LLYESFGLPLILDDTRHMVDAALAGAGLIYYPERHIQEQIESGRLELVLNQFAATSSGLYLYYPQRSSTALSCLT
jgi:DNA-binding transcriptional LysR family regulator